MPTNCTCRDAVNDGFQELALALGGVAASYEIPDEVVWDLARAIDVIGERVQAKLSRTEVHAGLDELPESGCSHPAVSHLLHRLRAGRGERGSLP